MAHWGMKRSGIEKVSTEFPFLELMIVMAVAGILVTMAIQKFLVH
jgi:hypothetical protein